MIARLATATATAIVGLLAALSPAAASPMDGMMGEMLDGGMWLLLLLLAIAIIATIVVVVRRAARGRRTDADLSPRELLDRRYAQGDLTREEYLQRRDDLDA